MVNRQPVLAAAVSHCVNQFEVQIGTAAHTRRVFTLGLVMISLVLAEEHAANVSDVVVLHV